MQHVYLFMFTASTLLFTGCSTCCFPSPHTYDKEIVFVKGAPYLIPYGTLFNTTPVSEEITRNDYRKYGHTSCENGDLLWVYPDTAKSLKKTYRTDGADAFSYAYGEAIRTGYMGCAKKLTQHEYDYYHTHYGL